MSNSRTFKASNVYFQIQGNLRAFKSCRTLFKVLYVVYIKKQHSSISTLVRHIFQLAQFGLIVKPQTSHLCVVFLCVSPLNIKTRCVVRICFILYFLNLLLSLAISFFFILNRLCVFTSEL